MSIAGLAQPARPVALVPDAALNALFSLLVPTAMLAILASLTRATSNRVLLPVLMWITASALLALLQAAGTMPDNPLINAAGDYAGFFANRNHQALFLAIGVVLSLFWGFERGAHWRSRRMWFAFAIAALLFVSILITGSRSGLFVGILGLLIALPFAQRGAFATGGCKRTAIILAGAVVLIAVAIYSSVYAGRALSIDRATAIPITGEFRLRALPTVWHLVETYFPVGSGFGSFDAVFRMAEPMDLLEPTYFNHAHNDWLEVVIEGGLPALLILGVTLVAFIRAAVAVFAGRKGDHPDVRQGRLGALIIVMVFVASVSDYPARTPIIMGVLVIAACWLCRGTWTARAGNAASHGTLPLQGESV